MSASRWLVATLVGLTLASCGAPTVPKKGAPNPVRAQIADAIASHTAKSVIQMRFNPGACDCPVYEVRLAKRWVRTQWTNETGATHGLLSQELRATPPAGWPVSFLVVGKFESDVLRTSQGLYAVQLEVTSVVGRKTSEAEARPTATSKPSGEKPAPEPKEAATTPKTKQPNATKK